MLEQIAPAVIWILSFWLTIYVYHRWVIEEGVKQRMAEHSAEITEIREQVQSLRRLLRGVIVGDERTVLERASDVQQERREEEYGPVYKRKAQAHDKDYRVAFGSLPHSELSAHLGDGLQACVGSSVYTLTCRTVEGYTVKSLILATSSNEDENTGDEEYPHLTDEAHERLCNALATLYDTEDMLEEYREMGYTSL